MKSKRQLPRRRRRWLKAAVEKLNDAFNQLQTASHKLAEALYQQTRTAGCRKRARRIRRQQQVRRRQAAAGDDNVIDAEYVDVDEKK